MALNSDFQKLYVDGLITLFELDARNLGAGILRFHGHISYVEWERIYSLIGSDGLLGDETNLIGRSFESTDQKTWYRNIIWQGETFEPMALEVSGLEMRSDGKASAPTFAMANNIGGIQFLNGVCRHEHHFGACAHIKFFLNGVCRHEHAIDTYRSNCKFLNGVCRHERTASPFAV